MRGESLTELLAQVTPLPVPDLDFELRGHIVGTATRLALETFDVRAGKHQLRAGAVLDYGERNRLDLRLDADTLDLNPLMAATDKPVHAPRAGQKPRAIPDTPLPSAWLTGIDAQAAVNVGLLRMGILELEQLEVVGTLGRGRLHIEPLRGSLNGGLINGAVTLEERNHELALQTRLQATDIRPGLLLSETSLVTQRPPWDVDLTMSGHGKRLRQLASTATGRLTLTAGAGRVRNTASKILYSDFIMEVFRTINPFAKRDAFTELQCGLAIVKADKGVVTTQAFLMQTDKLLLLSNGRLNLTNEAIDIEFRTHPREGIGISPNTIVNPYIKVAGTLAGPILALDPKSAVISGSAAAATGGLSILGKALWDRFAATGDVCPKELKKRGLRLPGSG